MARPKCPDCHKQLRVHKRAKERWLFCEECGWDERGKFEITVWDQEGDIVRKLWEANQSEVDEIEEHYGDNPLLTIMVDQLPQSELPTPVGGTSK